MKKWGLFLGAFFAALTTTYAQQINRLEGEIGIGYAWASGKFDGLKQQGGANLAIELRYNLSNKPFDVGVRASVTRLIRRVDQAMDFFDPHLRDDVMAIEVVGDYNFNRGGSTTFFVGCQFGYAWYDRTNPRLHVNETDQAVSEVLGEKGNGVVCTPRIGMEIFHRLRLTCSYTIADKYNSHMLIGAGFVFGGGKR